jgi:hypothetical protein
MAAAKRRLLQRDHGRHQGQTRALAASFDERVPSMPGPGQQWIADKPAMAPAQEFDRRFLLLGRRRAQGGRQPLQARRKNR